MTEVTPREGPDELPRNFANAIETGKRVLSELEPGTDLEEAVAQRREELRDLIAPFDAVHLLGQVMMSQSIFDPNTYSESETPGVAYIVELVAAELLTRPNRRGEKQPTPAIDAHVLEPTRRLTTESAFLESFRRFARAGGWQSAEGAARGRAASHHLYMRNPGWPWQEHETLRGLFGEQRFAMHLMNALGFDCEVGIRCSEALPDFVHRRLHEHMPEPDEAARDFGPQHPAYRWAEETLAGTWKDAPEEQTARFMPILWALNHVGEAFLFSAADLAGAADVGEPEAASYLSRLSLPFGQSETDWFRLAEAVRFTPFVEVEDRTYLPTVPGADLWALRDLFEGVLKDSAAYLDHRARWLEDKSATLVAAALQPDEDHRSLRYAYADGEAENVEGEIDALLRCGTTAVVVEAKSATMRPGARRGGEALIKHLRQTLTKAATQGTQAQRALGIGASLRAKDGTEVELGGAVHEVQPVVVTLDDLSAVAPLLWELEGTKTMPADVTVPWVVTLNELEHVVATVEWPLQLIHFLRRRSRLNKMGGRVASDELDWWMHYLQHGLYFKNEPEVRTRFLSLTDPLDAWVLYERGIRDVPAPKPAMNLPEASHAFVALLCSERPDGWVEAGCTMLEVDSDVQAEFWKDVKKMRKRARRREKVQRRCLGFTEGIEPMLVCAVIAPDAGQGSLLDSLRRYVGERLEEWGPQPVLGIGRLASSKRPYDALVVLARRQLNDS